MYCETPFGKIHTGNPEILSLAKALGRSPSAVSWKLANFARLDPTLRERNIKGATHGSKDEEAIWKEFESNWDALALKAEQLRNHAQARYEQEDQFRRPEGLARDAWVKVRVNQAFFRRAILAAYNSKCCITGIQVQELLCASHIVPWAADTDNRTNPSNGLCLNALHDRAFDRGLMTITPDFRVQISAKVIRMPARHHQAMLLDFSGQRITLPDRFVPQEQFLAFHNEHIFQG